MPPPSAHHYPSSTAKVIARVGKRGGRAVNISGRNPIRVPVLSEMKKSTAHYCKALRTVEAEACRHLELAKFGAVKQKREEALVVLGRGFPSLEQFPNK